MKRLYLLAIIILGCIFILLASLVIVPIQLLEKVPLLNKEYKKISYKGYTAYVLSGLDSLATCIEEGDRQKLKDVEGEFIKIAYTHTNIYDRIYLLTERNKILGKYNLKARWTYNTNLVEILFLSKILNFKFHYYKTITKKGKKAMTVKRLTEKRIDKVKKYICAKGVTANTITTILKQIKSGTFSGTKSNLPKLVRLCISRKLATNNGSLGGNQVTLTDFGEEIMKKGKI